MEVSQAPGRIIFLNGVSGSGKSSIAGELLPTLEDTYCEVEVTLGDGSETDVQLDRDFNVVSSEGDEGDGAEDDDE